MPSDAPITYGLVAIFILGVSFAVSVVLYVSKRFSDSDKHLAEHKLHAAETFATKGALTESYTQVRDALDRLGGRIDELLRIERRKDE